MGECHEAMRQAQGFSFRKEEVKDDQTQACALAKMGLDCHDTGIATVAQMREWIRGHLYGTPHADEVVNTAIAEDVDLIGVSFLSGQHGDADAHCWTPWRRPTWKCRSCAGASSRLTMHRL